MIRMVVNKCLEFVSRLLIFLLEGWLFFFILFRLEGESEKKVILDVEVKFEVSRSKFVRIMVIIVDNEGVFMDILLKIFVNWYK